MFYYSYLKIVLFIYLFIYLFYFILFFVLFYFISFYLILSYFPLCLIVSVTTTRLIILLRGVAVLENKYNI